MNVSNILDAQKKHYDRVAGEYASRIGRGDYDYYFRFTLDAIVRELASRFGALETLRGLDIGCGVGDFTAAISQRTASMTGTDLSPAMTGVARDAHADRPNLAFTPCRSDRLPFNDGAFDFVMAVHLLHHLAAPGLVRDTLAEMARVVRPGGALIVVDVNRLNPASILIQRMMVARGVDTGDERLVWPGTVRKHLRHLGLQEISHRGLCFVPHFVPWLAPTNDAIGRWMPDRWIGKDYLVSARRVLTS